MTWSLSASGSKSEVLDLVAKNGGPHEESYDRKQYVGVRDFVIDQLKASSEDAQCSVSCSGHADPNDSYASISFRAKVTAPAPSDG